MRIHNFVIAIIIFVYALTIPVSKVCHEHPCLSYKNSNKLRKYLRIICMNHVNIIIRVHMMPHERLSTPVNSSHPFPPLAADAIHPEIKKTICCVDPDLI